MEYNILVSHKDGSEFLNSYAKLQQGLNETGLAISDIRLMPQAAQQVEANIDESNGELLVTKRVGSPIETSLPSSFDTLVD